MNAQRTDPYYNPAPKPKPSPAPTSSTHCPTCGGRGWVERWGNSCRTCGGSGRKQR